MKRGLGVSLAMGSLLLTGLVAAAAWTALNACALNLPFLTHLSTCARPERLAMAARIDGLTGTRVELQRRVFELERELGSLQCQAVPADPNAPLTPEGWAAGDVSMLFGCWGLDATYRTRDVDTGAIRTYREWRMCFDGGGKGQQTMTSQDGVKCEGAVTAAFAGGRLQLVEPGNLSCSDGGYIHQREIACDRDGGGAICDTLQPETRGAARVGFRRAP